jgi:hypothetical protein
MTPEVADFVSRLFTLLEDDGLLLVADPVLPSVVTVIAGDPVRGSWWGHPRGTLIYAVAMALDAHPDIVSAPLLSGKATYVHRRLWPALRGVATSGAPWQLDGLSPLAQLLLAAVTRDGVVETHDAAEMDRFGRRALGEAAREIERALLARGESVHTASGAHAKRLETWARWAERVRCPDPLPAGEATRALGAAVAALNARAGDRARLPWQSPQPAQRATKPKPSAM